MCHQLTQGGRQDNSWRGFQPRGGATIIVGEGRGYQLEEFQKRVSVTEYRGVSEIGAFKILSLPKRCHQLTQGGRHDNSWRGVSGKGISYTEVSQNSVPSKSCQCHKEDTS